MSRLPMTADSECGNCKGAGWQETRCAGNQICDCVEPDSLCGSEADDEDSYNVTELERERDALAAEVAEMWDMAHNQAPPPRVRMVLAAVALAEAFHAWVQTQIGTTKEQQRASVIWKDKYEAYKETVRDDRH